MALAFQTSPSSSSPSSASPPSISPSLARRLSAPSAPGLCAVALAGFLSIGVPAQASEPAATETTARQGESAPAGLSAGFLYGRIETRYRTYEGRLRWDEEAFWDQYLDSRKERLPHWNLVPIEARTRRTSFSFLGAEGSQGRLRSQRRGFRARFGDIALIEPHSREWSTVTMRDGSRYELEGGGDLWSRVQVFDAEHGTVAVDWERIRRIVFLPTPADLETDVARLFGTVQTSYGTFEGAIQWDQDESTSTDELDGDDRDGQRRSIPMGEIESLEQAGNRTRVRLWSGEQYELGGTNDVDRGNRGIWIHDVRYGRVLVPWPAFERLDFDASAAEVSTGPGYQDFSPGRAIRGRVERHGGSPVTGRIAWDVDEERSWEVLDGELVVEEGALPARMPVDDSEAASRPGEANPSSEAAPRPGRVDDSMDVSIQVEVGGDGAAVTTGEAARESDFEGDDEQGRRGPGLEVGLLFEQIAAIDVEHVEDDPRQGRIRALLNGGETLELGGTQDVDGRNAGLLVFPDGGASPVYVPWADVRRVELARAE